MPSLQDIQLTPLQAIQEKVERAQEKIRNCNFDRVRTADWPIIRDEISSLGDLPRQVRFNLGLIIHKLLAEQDENGGAFTRIIVEQILSDLQAGRLQVPAPSRVIKWLPY